MRYLLVLLALLPALAGAQTQNVQARANISWQLPITYTDGTSIPAGSLTKIQVWVKTAEIWEASLGAPVAELPGTATRYEWTGTVPNGATIRARVKACNATACGALSAPASKGVKIDVPNAPTGTAITVIVTLTGP